MVGAFLSTLLPPIGPAVEQLPATSHTARLLVEALTDSVPAGTLVESVKPLPSPPSARPDTESLAAHWTLTSPACQIPSACPHETEGAPLSIFTTAACGDSPLPALSVAK